jgi:subtilisin family serine protease
MNVRLEREIHARGRARVMIFLKRGLGSDASVVERVSDSRYSTAARQCGRKRWTEFPARAFPHLDVVLGSVDEAALDRLRSDSAVLDVAITPPIVPLRPVRVKAALPAAGPTWGLRALGVEDLWDKGLDGTGVRIGHLDSGVDDSHKSLAGAVTAFAEFDDSGREIRPGRRPLDRDGHGTHTAATMVGRPTDGRRIGVAPGATLCSAKVIEGGDVIGRVLAGMDWALKSGIRILNISLGFPGYWDDFLPLTRRIRDRGVLPVFAVGNEGPGTSRSPGNYSEAVSVGASSPDLRIAPFSSSARFRRKVDPIVPDLVGPGVDVISAAPGGGFQSMDGTSMAAPHISGLAALLWQACPSASLSEIEQALLESCHPLPRTSPFRQGRGLPSAPRALAALLPQRCLPTPLTSSGPL